MEEKMEKVSLLVSLRRLLFFEKIIALNVAVPLLY